MRKYVSVDGGMTDNIRPALYQAKYEGVAANKASCQRNDKVTVCGKCCESGDILMKDIEMAEPETGDIIAIFSTGAYGYSMASNYNRNPIPAVVFVKDYAAQSGSVIAITGAIDLISDGKTCYVVHNGRPEMGRITGTGCQLSGMMTAFLAANPDDICGAAAAAVCTMGLAGEIAYDYMQPGDGNATYRNRIIDAIYNMTPEMLEKGAKYEVR